MNFFELFGTLGIFMMVLVFLVAIAPLFIWVHVRAIRYMLEDELRHRRNNRNGKVSALGHGINDDRQIAF